MPGAPSAKAYCVSAVLSGTGYAGEDVCSAAGAIMLSGGPKGSAKSGEGKRARSA